MKHAPITDEKRDQQNLTESTFRRGYSQGVYGAVEAIMEGVPTHTLQKWREQVTNWRYTHHDVGPFGHTHPKEWPPKRPAVSVKDGQDQVYYVQRTSDGRIKIGHSTDIQAAIRRIKHGAGHVILLALEPGGVTIERDRHAQFHKERMKGDGGGEWFKPSIKLTDHIRKLQ